MNKNKFIPAKSSKLTDSQRVTIFNAFDAAAKIINKKTSYIRRFSEPRKNGLGYRCKFWGVSVKNIDTAKLIAKIQKALPDGYTAELSSGSWTYDIIIRTPKFTADSTVVDTMLPTDTADNAKSTIVKTWANVDFQAPMCPPMAVTVYCEIELDPAGNVVSKEATDLKFSCPEMPEATSDELSGTMSMMSGLLGVEGIKDAVVEAGKKGLELCVEEVVALHKQGEFTSMQDEDTVKPTKGADRMDKLKDQIIERQAAEIVDLKHKLARLESDCDRIEAQFSELNEEYEELRSAHDNLIEECQNLDITGFLEDSLRDVEWSEYLTFEMASDGSIRPVVDTNTLAVDVADSTNAYISNSYSI
jgi:hypothetical protein